MFPNTSAAKSVSDYRPIADARLLYIPYAGTHRRFIWSNATGRTTWFPARKTHRRRFFDCQRLLAKKFGRKCTTLDQFGSFQTFDKADWNALWFALTQHGISEHVIRIFQRVYDGHTRVIRKRDVDSCGFDIRGCTSGDWNARVAQFVEQYSVKHCSVRCLEMH